MTVDRTFESLLQPTLAHDEVLAQVERGFAAASGRGAGVSGGGEASGAPLLSGGEVEEGAAPQQLLTERQRRFLRSFASAVQCWQRSPLAPPSGFKQGVG